SAAAQVLALINQARSAAGLAPLTITTGLNSSASAHNSRMAGGCGLSHQCPGEPDLGARETAAGVHWTAAGENIGEGGPVGNTTTPMSYGRGQNHDKVTSSWLELGRARPWILDSSSDWRNHCREWDSSGFVGLASLASRRMRRQAGPRRSAGRTGPGRATHR